MGALLDASSLTEDVSNEGAPLTILARKYCHLNSGETLGGDTQKAASEERDSVSNPPFCSILPAAAT